MWSEIKNIVRRAYITLTNNDNAQFSIAQASSMDKTTDIETIYPYGLFAQAPLNTLVLLFTVQGNEENLAGIPYGGMTRFKGLNPGEVLLGNVLTETFIKLDQNGNIDIDAKNDITINVTGNVNITAQQVTIDAPLTELGNGGNRIARLGDQVTTNISGVDHIGVITSAGTNTSI